MKAMPCFSASSSSGSTVRVVRLSTGSEPRRWAQPSGRPWRVRLPGPRAGCSGRCGAVGAVDAVDTESAEAHFDLLVSEAWVAERHPNVRPSMQKPGLVY